MRPLESLLEKIRTEPFVLWAGAGLSLYAGYPSASSITSFLNDALGENRQSDTASLDQIAGIYATMHSRDDLIELVYEKFFANLPKTFKYHELLASLPVFKTILTTNYDPLFELAYKTDLVKVCSMRDFAKLNTTETTLIKLHGDFSQPDKLVITKDDYARFLATESQTILYKTLLYLLATHYVLLIGYSFEDINAMVLQVHLDRELGEHRKPWWLVAPGLKEYQVRDLRSRKIEVIDMIGEQFITILKKTFDDHIIADHAAQRISTSLLAQFLFLNDISSTFTRTIKGDKLVGISSLDPGRPLQQTMSFEISDNPQMKKAIEALARGRSFKDLGFDSSQIPQLNFRVNGILFKQEKVLNMILSPVPLLDKTVGLRYGGKMIDGVNIKFFSSATHVGLRFSYENLNLDSAFPLPLEKEGTAELKITIEQNYPSVKAGLDIHSFLTYTQTNGKFSVEEQAQETWELGFTMSEDHYQRSLVLRDHFEKLLRIEEFFSVSFSNISVTEESVYEVDRLYRLMDGMWGDFSPLKITMEKRGLNIEVIKEARERTIPLKAEFTQESPVLYGVVLPPSRMHLELEDGIIRNLDKFLDKKTRVLEIESESRRMLLQLMHPVLKK